MANRIAQDYRGTVEADDLYQEFYLLYLEKRRAKFDEYIAENTEGGLAKLGLALKRHAWKHCKKQRELQAVPYGLSFGESNRKEEPTW